MKTKDAKKVAAGRKGGRVSPTNFKRNRELARRAGLASAQARLRRKVRLENYEFEDLHDIEPVIPRARRRRPLRATNDDNVLDNR